MVVQDASSGRKHESQLVVAPGAPPRTMPAMGGNRSAAAVLLCWLLLSGCGEDVGAAVKEDELVLEVGGSAGSLRDALAQRGVVIAPPIRVRSAEPEPRPAPNGGGRPEPSPTPTPRVTPSPAPPEPAPAPKIEPPAPTYRIVKLAKRQTLMHLSKQHLGDANRFREIMQLNGWDDAAARRLPEGQDVKIPIDPPR